MPQGPAHGHLRVCACRAGLRGISELMPDKAYAALKAHQGLGVQGAQVRRTKTRQVNVGHTVYRMAQRFPGTQQEIHSP